MINIIFVYFYTIAKMGHHSQNLVLKYYYAENKAVSDQVIIIIIIIA